MSVITRWLFNGPWWTLSASHFVLLLSAFSTLFFNVALFDFVQANLDIFSVSGAAIALSVTAIVLLFNYVFYSCLLLIAPLLIKPFFMVTALISAVALYYMMTYQVVLNKEMISNIFNTRRSEAFELFSFTLLLYFIFFGLLPACLIVKLSVKKPLDRLRTVFNLLLVIVLSSAFLYINAAGWLWIDKYASLLGGKILPWSYVINTARHYADTLEPTEQVLLPAATFADNEKRVVVLVIGETARANNFSLYGYPRLTNPLLAEKNLLTFNRTRACTTYTTGSVACMLAHDIEQTGYEPLPSYLARSGADVIWRTNNWGEPPIQVSQYQEAAELRQSCEGNGCAFDEVLLTDLQQKIRASDKQQVLVVLHTKGSHGPSYYARYPAEFEQFTPVCRYEELSKCTEQELINAYDNTILYTDYFLHKTIEVLEQLEDTATLLVYVSDHGESLGENGLFLHGTPYLFAPKYQKEIPFLIWRSDPLIAQQALANAEVKQSGAFSQANIFHTVVGAFGLQSDVYQRELDVLAR